MEKLLVAHIERLFVVEARIEPSTFWPVVQCFILPAIVRGNFCLVVIAFVSIVICLSVCLPVCLSVYLDILMGLTV
jgi:hypothetical protein